MLGICIGSAALIIILSIFNGFEGLVLSLYNKLTPDIRITSIAGKTFDPSDPKIRKAENHPGIDFSTHVLEENALLKYGNNQFFAIVKGVSNEFLKMPGLDAIISRGNFVLKEDEQEYAVIGKGIEYGLSINLQGGNGSISVLTPKKDAKFSTMQPEQALNRLEIYPSGIFSVQQEMDEKYMIVPISFARKLFGEKQNISSIELSLKPGTNEHKVIKELLDLTGNRYHVKDRYQQNELLYKIMNSEKWAVYLILSFVLVIAICNIIGSITMLVIDKKKDISVLMSLGADQQMVRRIILAKGLLISGIGSIAGLLIGFIFCLLQQQFGFISIGEAGAFLVDSYPVLMKAGDFLLVFMTVFLIAFIASWTTAHYNARKIGTLNEELKMQ